MNGWQNEKQPYQWQKLGQPLTEIQRKAQEIASQPAEEYVMYPDLDALAGQFTASE